MVRRPATPGCCLGTLETSSCGDGRAPVPARRVPGQWKLILRRESVTLPLLYIEKFPTNYASLRDDNRAEKTRIAPTAVVNKTIPEPPSGTGETFSRSLAVAWSPQRCSSFSPQRCSLFWSRPSRSSACANAGRTKVATTKAQTLQIRFLWRMFFIVR